MLFYSVLFTSSEMVLKESATIGLGRDVSAPFLLSFISF